MLFGIRLLQTSPTGMSQLGRSDEEQLYLELAKKSLKVWLASTPGKEARKLGEQILRMFR